MNEIQALQNAANATNLEGIKISEFEPLDKRKSVKRYIANLPKGGAISPILDYEQMNYYLLGMIKHSQILNN
jgi:hypothetical protein